MRVDTCHPIIGICEAAGKIRRKHEGRGQHFPHNAPCCCAVQVHAANARAKAAMRIQHSMRKGEACGFI